jgi:hypothetical protein
MWLIQHRGIRAPSTRHIDFEKSLAAADKAMGTLEQAGDKIEEATDSSP